jgi:hypothetical protein
MKSAFAFLILSAPLWALKPDSPSGNRTTPPIIRSFSPMGFPRGTTATLVIEGLNLDKTSKIYFSKSGIQGAITTIEDLPDIEDNRRGSNGGVSTIDLGPLPAHKLVTVELQIAKDAPIGPVNFRLQTPLGTTPTGRFVIEPAVPEVPEHEHSGGIESATTAPIPSVLTGVISKPGDVDYFQISPAAGQRVLIEFSADSLGTALQPVIGVLNRDGKQLHEFTASMGRNSFVHEFKEAGPAYIRITDYQDGGDLRHFYRLRVVDAPAAAAPVSSVKSTNIDLAHADQVGVPGVVAARLNSPDHYYKFHARKDQKVIIDILANRTRSPLDSVIEILDVNGKPVERATVRCVLETAITLRDHDSSSGGIRLLSPAGLKPGDLIMVGAEIMQLDKMPRSPDDDTQFYAFEAQRVGMLDTTPESHALDQPVYKVQVAPPASHFPSNGLPLVHLPYRNDDGGPGYGKDSLLHFTAPAEADYIVRISDVRGSHGDDFRYVLHIHEPRPDFALSVNPRNPNVPAGGRIPITVTARRIDDFDGPIKLEIKDLPPGLHATTSTILPGDVRTTILLSADENASLPGAAALKIVATDYPNRTASPEDRLKLISVVPPSDVQMTAQTRKITLSQDGKATVEVSIKRNNGFAGRIPVEVRNLPPGVEIIDVGLNGVLINETETHRSFTLQALPTAHPLQQPIFASAAVETRGAGQQNTFTSEPIELTILPKQP